MRMSNPSHLTKFHRLAPDIEAYLHELVAARGMKTACSVLSTTKITIEKLFDVGLPRYSRDRVEETLARIMRADGLVPSPRAPATPTPPKVREPGINSRDIKSCFRIEEAQGVRRGQSWTIVEPCGREFRLKIEYIVRDPQKGFVAYGKTPSGKTRTYAVRRLAKRIDARLVEDAAPTARAS